MSSLRWEESGVKKEFSLRSRVSTKWRDLGIQLDMTLNELEAIERDRTNTNERWMHVMQRWLDGCCKIYPPTWDGLYKLLQDAGTPGIARELKDAVQSYTTYSL